MTFSISIMAYHTRDKYVSYLKGELGDVPVAMDYGEKGIWQNCKDAWRLHDNKKWHCVLQDDSIIGKDFHRRAEKILDSEDCIVSLYAGEKLGAKIGEVWEGVFVSDRIFNENALCMQTKHIEPMIEFCDSRNAKNDKLINKYAKMKGLKIHYPIPSLIDHREIESIYRKQRNKTQQVRKAYKFL